MSLSFLGIIGLLTLSIDNIFFAEVPLLQSVGHLAISVVGTCVWLLVYNVRIKITRVEVDVYNV